MRLVLADDHNLFREALCFYLRQGYADIEILEAANLGEALAMSREGARDGKPDAMLLDYVMPGMNGLAGIRRARQDCPEIPIVILSGNISQAEAAEAISCGAAGVISKDLTGDALIQALRRILAGEAILVSPSWTGGGAVADVAPGVSERPWKSFGLTARETDVIRLLSRGLGNKAIAYELGIAEITVRLHLQSAFRKMGARNRVDALRIALQSGFPAEPASSRN